MRKYFLVALLPFALISCTAKTKTVNQDDSHAKAEKHPLNVILLIGDGMGLSQVSTTFYFADSSNFQRFKHIGLINTSSKSDKITDSGAGGAAFAIGEKTYNGAIGVGMDSLSRPNLTEIFSKNKYATGIVVTCQMPHATPADFFAHVKKRYSYDEIAKQLVNSDVDFFAGGGTDYFLRRKDGINYFDSLIAHGFVMDTFSLDNELDANKKYGYLLAPVAMPTMLENRGDYLPKATKKSLDYLSMHKNGFFLMIEGSQIDWACHANDAAYLISEMLDFNKSVGVALDFAENDGNTLVIVLADHETGGFTLAASNADKMEGDYNNIEPKFSTSGHSTTLIPVFAFGPGAQLFGGVYQNADIFHKILEATRKN